MPEKKQHVWPAGTMPTAMMNPLNRYYRKPLHQQVEDDMAREEYFRKNGTVTVDRVAARTAIRMAVS